MRMGNYSRCATASGSASTAKAPSVTEHGSCARSRPSSMPSPSQRSQRRRACPLQPARASASESALRIRGIGQPSPRLSARATRPEHTLHARRCIVNAGSVRSCGGCARLRCSTTPRRASLISTTASKNATLRHQFRSRPTLRATSRPPLQWDRCPPRRASQAPA